jgi:hypothetical protein
MVDKQILEIFEASWCPLSWIKWTWAFKPHMPAFDPERTWAGHQRKPKCLRFKRDKRLRFTTESCTLYVSEGYWGCQMDTMARISGLAESHRHDQFIPVRKEDLFSALIKQGELADPGERELFWRFARTLRTICHYEYSEVLDRLRDDYYYFSPEVAGHAAADRAKSDSAYDDLIRSLDKVLKGKF